MWRWITSLALGAALLTPAAASAQAPAAGTTVTVSYAPDATVAGGAGAPQSSLTWSATGSSNMLVWGATADGQPPATGSNLVAHSFFEQNNTPFAAGDTSPVP